MALETSPIGFQNSGRSQKIVSDVVVGPVAATTVALNVPVPEGCLVVGTSILHVVADTDAGAVTMNVGDGTTADKFHDGADLKATAGTRIGNGTTGFYAADGNVVCTTVEAITDGSFQLVVHYIDLIN